MSGRFHQSSYLKPSGNTNDGISPPSPDATLDGGATSTVAAAMTTVPVWVHNLDAYSVHFSTPAGSTLVGTLTLQASNDRGNVEQTGKPDPTMLNWVTLNFWDVGAGAQAASKAVASGANQLMLADRNCTYRWVRLVFAFTSGTGSVRAAIQQKGAA